MSTPTKLSAADLAKNARIINTEHKAVVEATQAKLQHAITAGATLKACKESMAHGNWANWLKDNCPEISERTASVYMRLAKNSDKVEKAAEENGSSAADLSMRAMLKLLRKPKTDEQKATATPKPKTTTNPRAAVEPSDTKRDEDVGKDWLKELAADELVTVLREFRDDDYLRQLSVALAKALAPKAQAPIAPVIAGVARVLTPQAKPA
jgi:Protein of unknown function (DUF3102)